MTKFSSVFHIWNCFRVRIRRLGDVLCWGKKPHTKTSNIGWNLYVFWPLATLGKGLVQKALLHTCQWWDKARGWIHQKQWKMCRGALVPGTRTCEHLKLGDIKGFWVIKLGEEWVLTLCNCSFNQSSHLPLFYICMSLKKQLYVCSSKHAFLRLFHECLAFKKQWIRERQLGSFLSYKYASLSVWLKGKCHEILYLLCFHQTNSTGPDRNV